MIQNVVIGKSLVDPADLLAANAQDWEDNEKAMTMFTEERFLPRILVASGLVKSTSEVRRNQPQLFRNLDFIGFERIKWGKKFLWIIIGE